MPGPSYEWIPVDGAQGRACRGATASDNAGSYFTAISPVASLEACQEECLKVNDCKGASKDVFTSYSIALQYIISYYIRSCCIIL